MITKQKSVNHLSFRENLWFNQMIHFLAEFRNISLNVLALKTGNK